MPTILEFIAPKQAERLADLEKKAVQWEGREQESDAMIRALEDTVAILGEAMRDTLHPMPFSEALEALREGGIEETILMTLVQQLGWDQVSTLTGATQDDSGERNASVKQAERLFRYSPLGQWCIWLWTGWGLGDKMQVIFSDDESAQAWWNEFFNADRNAKVLGQDTISELSDWLLVKGNRFLAIFVATEGEFAGRATIRVLDQDEIEVIRNPEDKQEPWFYKRTYSPGNSQTATIYYPDWESLLQDKVATRWASLLDRQLVPSEAKLAEQDGTRVPVFHIAHNRKDEKSLWGWPILTAASPWLSSHKKFMEARLGVALAVAQFVRRTQVQGGSRAVGSILSQIKSTLGRNRLLDSNPPGAPGSWHVENQASDTSELPLRTGATDAKSDNEAFSWMALLGAGLFPTSAGLDTSRWATAVEMDKAQSMLFERYQRFWSAQFSRLGRIVLTLGEMYAKQSFADKTPEISIDTFSLADFASIATPLSVIAATMLTQPYEAGLIEPDMAQEITRILWRITLQALGISKAHEITTTEPIEESLVDAVRDKYAKLYAENKISAPQLAEGLVTDLLGILEHA